MKNEKGVRREANAPFECFAVLNGAACLLSCPASPACLVSRAWRACPAADVPAAVFAPAFVAAGRVSAQAVEAAVAVFVQVVAVFDRLVGGVDRRRCSTGIS